VPNLEEKLRQFESRLEERIRRHRRRVTKPEFAAGDIEERIREYESRLEEQIEAHRRKVWRDIEEIWQGVGEAIGPHPPPGERVVALEREPVLQQLDRLMWEEFGLGRYFPENRLARYPVIYCETLEEYFQPFVEILNISKTTKRRLIKELKARAEEKATRGEGELGINWPGRGCYLNGWLFAYGRAPNARAALRNPHIFPLILSAAAHEKLGHGFITEFTAMGQEKERLGLWRYEIARNFSLRTADTPRSALLREKEHIVYASSRLLEEGWATWIEEHALHRAREAGILDLEAPLVPTGRYSLGQVWHLLDELRTSSELEVAKAAEAVSRSVAVLLLGKNPESGEVHRAVLTIHRYSPLLDDSFARAFGQPVAYVLGYLLMRRLEARLGTLCLPHAVCIAATITYDLEHISASDLGRLVAENPCLNADSRLAHLGLLDLSSKGDVKELAHRAHEELNLAVPEGW